MNKPPPPRRRQALQQIGGALRTSGDKAIARSLADALVRAEKEPADALTHGFHVYPARMHRGVVLGVLDAYPKARSLHDPFCGSGTSLVEARLRGLQTFGSDLNPLAVRLARLKTHAPPPQVRAEIATTAEAIAEASHQRVKSKTRVRAPLLPVDAKAYSGHVLLELAGLLEEIRAGSVGPVRDALELVFSAMVGKFSQRRAETDRREAPKTIGRHVPTKFFVRKTAELIERWGEFADALPPDSPFSRVRVADIRTAYDGPLCDLVLTSPPYGGTYDYQAQHHLRLAWLGIDDRSFAAKEVGARRRADPAEALSRWNGEILETLKALECRVQDSGTVVVLMGDGQVGDQRVKADRQFRELAPQAGLTVVAIASQARADRRGGAPREEHLIALQRSASRPPRA